MSIVEKELPNWNQKLRYEKHKYPNCNCGNCPRFYFNIISCASRGQGKTYSICQLIKHYENNNIIDENGNKIELRTWLISPTSQANTVFTSLKSLNEEDIRDDYDDNTLKDILDEIKQTKKKKASLSSSKEKIIIQEDSLSDSSSSSEEEVIIKRKKPHKKTIPVYDEDDYVNLIQKTAQEKLKEKLNSERVKMAMMSLFN